MCLVSVKDPQLILISFSHPKEDVTYLRFELAEDSGVAVVNRCAYLLPGVADGVGGWRDYGVDPSQFSGTLMKTCERLVKEGRFVSSSPVGVLTTGYYELLQNKVPLLGE